MDPNKKVFNLASWSMAHKSLVYFFMVLFSIAGISLDVKVVVSNSSNFICASTDYAPDSTVCSKRAA